MKKPKNSPAHRAGYHRGYLVARQLPVNEHEPHYRDPDFTIGYDKAVAEYEAEQKAAQEQPAEPYSAATDAMRDLAHNFANTAYGMGYDHGYELGFAAGELTPRNEPAPDKNEYKNGYDHGYEIGYSDCDAELDKLKDDFDKLRAQHTALRQEATDLALEHEQVKASHDLVNDDYKQLLLDNEKLTASYDEDLHHDNEMLAKQVEGLVERNAILDTALLETKAAFDGMLKQYNNDSVQLKNLHMEKQRLETEVARLDQRSQTTLLESFNTGYTQGARACDNQVAALRSLLSEKDAENTALQNKLNEAGNEIAHLNIRAEAAWEETEKTTKLLETTHADNNELRNVVVKTVKEIEALAKQNQVLHNAVHHSDDAKDYDTAFMNGYAEARQHFRKMLEGWES